MAIVIPSSLAATLSSSTAAAEKLSGSAASAYGAGLPWFEFASAIFTTAAFAIAIYFLLKTGYIQLRIDRVRNVILQKDSVKLRVRSSWDDIERHFFAGDDNDLRIALIEADAILDEALRGAGVQGAQLGDRLKKVRPDQLPNVEDVWQAHKLRNRIAHEPTLSLKRDIAEKALTIYETALQHLGFLDPGAAGLTEPTESST